MAATAISVWMSKQAEPLTVEEYCANCRVLDVQQENINLLKSPSTALPVLRIFGKDIQVCQQTCQNLRPIFNIQFECVPMAQASKETIKEVYMEIDFLAKGGNLAENKLINQKLANKENLNEKKEEYILLSSVAQKRVKTTDQKIVSASKNQNTRNNQEKADQAAANFFLESNPKTIFFIGGYILTFDGIPNKENICEVVNDSACPLKNSSSIVPNEFLFGLIKNCYARGWGGGRPSATTNRSSHWGGSRPSATTNHSSHWGGSRPSATTNHSNHWTQPASSPSSSSSEPTINTDSVTWNDDGSVTIGGNGSSQTLTDGFTGSWEGGTFNVGSSGTGGNNLTINLGGNNSGSNITLGNNGITSTNNSSVSSGNVEVSYSSITINVSENAIDYPTLMNTLNSINALNQNFALAISPELINLASSADTAWIAQILSNPNQNFYYALTHGGIDINTDVQTGAMITQNLISVGSDIYVAMGDTSWDSYFYSGSPHEITTSDGSNWELTMMTHMTNNSSTEFLAYNPIVNNGDGTFGNFVPYNPADPNANVIAYAYRFIAPEIGGSGGSGGSGGGWVPSVAPTVNRAPSAIIACYPSCEVTTKESTSFILKESHDDPDGDPVTCNWEIYRCQNQDCSIRVRVPIPNSNVCSDLSSPVSQVGHYQARFVVNDGEFSVYATPDSLNFYILQAITALFDYKPEEPHYGEEIQFIDQSAGTGNSSGGNYSITNWDWIFKDVEGKEPTQTSIIQNPKITFTEDGWKKVTLTVIDQTNRSANYSENIYAGFPPPNWRETHPGQEQQQGNQQSPQSCREKCESLGYMYGICRQGETLDTPVGCEINEKDIGGTFDCKSSVEIGRTCCCRYLK